MNGEIVIAAGSLAVALVAAGFTLSQARSARQSVRRSTDAIRIAEHANRQVADLQKRAQLTELRSVLRTALAEARMAALNQARWQGVHLPEVRAALAGLHAQLPRCAALLALPLPGVPALTTAIEEITRVAEATAVTAA
ncbi:hypothetical protein [Streptomyces sp. MJP52]|uniref:hypothetical protein n=1 Tax=Streptomyces sp. MJP52 TaxID=2940555 RepID=UPI002476E98C|nr:hypothetical protein [Streptomyces sp. MJP52]